MDLEQIKQALEGHNLAEIARDMKCTRSYLSLIVNGARINPSYDFISRLSALLERKHAQ